MSYRLITLERDGTQGFSSTMTKSMALQFAKDHFELGIDVLRLEDEAGEPAFVDELAALREAT